MGGFSIAVPVMLIASSACLAAPVECPGQIRVAYADSELPPYIMGSGTDFQRPPGMFVEWTRNALRKLGCRASVRELRLPYNRIVASMGAGTVDIRVTAGFRADGMDVMQYPMRAGKPDASLAVAEAYTRLYVPKARDSSLSWDGKTLRKGSAGAVIGTVRGHFSEKALEARHFETESVPDWGANVKKLFAGRVDAIAGSDSVVDALPERSQMTTLEPPLQYDLFFAPVSHQFFQKHPQFTRRFWFEICRESRPTFKSLPACRKS